ncbi:molybdopterin cofactor-binding domain-containing protein [Chelativorans salis]|uniref:molybdopterin cofactor-binding domain-containing protein n=1 Tax=Chelativorans salis TaxID=2978478 RepID=UPI003CC5EDDE
MLDARCRRRHDRRLSHSSAEAAVVAPKPWTAPTDGVEINAWLTIDPDGTVTIRVPHTEQGQGALTSVSMTVAEELDVPCPCRVRGHEPPRR